MPSQPAASISRAARAAPRAEATVVIHSCTRFLRSSSIERGHCEACLHGSPPVAVPCFNVNCLNMSWKKREREARGYHHGNLREALIQAARELIAEKGPAGFTFADAARSAGVSAAAPYRHFRDRDALLADVAREGFQRFEAMLSTGWANGKPDPVTAFNNVGKAYLTFARAEPAYYAAMFESGLPPDANAELRAAGDRAFAVLRTAADALVALLPPGKRPPALMMSLHV